MTQKELKEKIDALFVYNDDAGFDRDFAPCSHDDGFICEHRLNSTLRLINEHVKEVIGKDKADPYTQESGVYDFYKIEDSLRQRQRKRAGL